MEEQLKVLEDKEEEYYERGGNSEVADKKRGKPLNSPSSSLQPYPYILTLLLSPFLSLPTCQHNVEVKFSCCHSTNSSLARQTAYYVCPSHSTNKPP